MAVFSAVVAERPCPGMKLLSVVILVAFTPLYCLWYARLLAFGVYGIATWRAYFLGSSMGAQPPGGNLGGAGCAPL